MTTFRHTFRAEAAIDLTRLLALILPLDPEFLLLSVQPCKVGGVEVDCISVLTHTNMLHRFVDVPDNHVMAQTLQTAPATPPPAPRGERSPS